VIKILLLIVGLLFLLIGILLFTSSSSIVELKLRYDEIEDCKVGSAETGYKQCTFNLEVEKEMKLPIYVYYELTNFYQNHRVYIQSLSQNQLLGTSVGPDEFCQPLLKDKNGTILYPCGLMANSFFTDRFTAKILKKDDTNAATLCSSCDDSYADLSDIKQKWSEWREDEKKTWRRDNIAWKVDESSRFQDPTFGPETYSREGYRQEMDGLLLPKVKDPDFIVWMRPAALPEFRKLYRVIDALPDGRTSLQKGDKIQVFAVNWFSVEEYKGTKSIVFTTLTWFGGKASSLGIAYIVVGGVSLLLALGLFVKEPSRSLGNYNFQEFNWKNLPNAGAQPTK